MNSDIVSANRNQLLELRKAVLKTRESKKEFEESPADFLANRIELDPQQYDSLIKALSETPKGLRSVTLDYAISMRLKDFDSAAPGTPGPSPKGPIPIPLVGVNVLAVYNAVVMGNVAAYHQVGAGVAVVAAAVAVKVAKFNGSGDIEIIGERAHPLPDCDFDQRYLMGGFHRNLQNRGFGEARERLYIRKIIEDNLDLSQSDCSANTPIKVKDDCVELTFCFSEKGSLLILDASEAK